MEQIIVGNVVATLKGSAGQLWPGMGMQFSSNAVKDMTFLWWASVLVVASEFLSKDGTKRCIDPFESHRIRRQHNFLSKILGYERNQNRQVAQEGKNANRNAAPL